MIAFLNIFNTLTLENIYVTGDINQKCVRYGGGLVGTSFANLVATNCGAYSPYGVIESTWKAFTSHNMFGTGKEAGGGSVGGFIGNLHGVTFKIDQCFATIYVSAYMNDNAAGFIARMGYVHSKSGDPSYITHCYAGGHTVNGIYEDTEYSRPGIRGTWPSGYNRSARKAKLVAGQNVMGGTNTAGFVGFYQCIESGSYFDKCFTTASVGGTDASGRVGGFGSNLFNGNKPLKLIINANGKSTPSVNPALAKSSGTA